MQIEGEIITMSYQVAVNREETLAGLYQGKKFSLGLVFT